MIFLHKFFSIQIQTQYEWLLEKSDDPMGRDSMTIIFSVISPANI